MRGVFLLFSAAAALLLAGCGEDAENPRPRPQRSAVLPRTRLTEPPRLVLPDAPEAGDAQIIPAWASLTNAAAVKDAFRPCEATWPAVFVSPGVVKLPADFTGPPVQRTGWDVRLPCDLRMRPGLQFDFICGDLSQFTSFTCYLKSGDGWYGAQFAPEEDMEWTRVNLPKGRFRAEGRVNGWDGITTMRVCGWRAGTNATVCAIANVAASGGVPEVAIVYAESLASAGGAGASSYLTFASNVSASLEALGIGTVLVADTDLAPDTLASMKAAVLPYNPSMPSNAVAAVRKFVLGGRKLLGCYSLPKEVSDLLGVRIAGTVQPPAIGGFLRAGEGLAGQPEFVPQASWITCAAAPKGGALVVATWADGRRKPMKKLPALVRASTGVYMAHVWLGGTSGAQAELMRAIVCELSPELMAKTAARDAARDKRREEIRAWLAGRSSVAGEHRAFWCHSARGLGGGYTWDATARLLKASGFNAVFANVCWAGAAFYESAVLPVVPDVAARGDALEACLAACRKNGVECHAWRVCWNMGNCTPASFENEMAATNRVQVSFDGKVKRRWLCPSHPDNQKLEVEAMCELAHKGVDGIHFDYIRYPDVNHCFCGGCRERFEAYMGVALTNWPAQVRTDDAFRRGWAAFRAANISDVVREVSRRVRAERPGVRISAAVYRNPSTDADTIGQDWPAWCRNGWLDFVCPMDYVESPAMFKSQARVQRDAVGAAKLRPGIGLSCWTNDGEDAVRLAKQIQAVRDLGLGGFAVFNLDRRAEAVLPLLRMGVTKEN